MKSTLTGTIRVEGGQLLRKQEGEPTRWITGEGGRKIPLTAPTGTVPTGRERQGREKKKISGWTQRMKNELGTRKRLLEWTLHNTPELGAIIQLLQDEVTIYEQIVERQQS